MSELIKPEENLSLSKKIVFSKQTSIIRDHDSDSIHDVVKIGVVKAKQTTGYNILEDDLRIFISDLKNELLSSYKGLHLSEISIALDLWAKKHYGDWIGFTISNCIAHGIRPYYADKVRLEVIKQKEDIPRKCHAPFDGEALLNKMVSQYNSNGWADDWNNTVYDWLVEVGRIEAGYGNQFMKQAKIFLLSEQHEQLEVSGDRLLRNTINKAIGNIEMTIDRDNYKSHPVVIMAKKLAFNEYLNKVCTEEKEKDQGKG